MKKKCSAKKGIVVVLSAPSGCGKTTVEALLLKQVANLTRSISATTRSRRKGERSGKDYFFLTKEVFLAERKKGGFLEWAQVFDNYYGTPKSFVDKMLCAGNDVLLTIDVQGALKIKKKLPDAVFVGLVPPSLATLEDRLTKRGTDAGDEIKKRLREAKRELKEMRWYDYVVVNEALSKAVCDIESIIKTEKLKVTRNKEVLRGICSP